MIDNFFFKCNNKNFRIRIFIIYFSKQKCCFKIFRKKFLNKFRTKNHRFRIGKSNLFLLLRSNTNKKRHQMRNNHKIIVYYCQYPTNHCHLFRFAVHVLHFVSLEGSNLDLVVSNFCQVIFIQIKNESQIHSGRSESSGKLS